MQSAGLRFGWGEHGLVKLRHAVASNEHDKPSKGVKGPAERRDGSGTASEFPIGELGPNSVSMELKKSEELQPS